MMKPDAPDGASDSSSHKLNAAHLGGIFCLVRFALRNAYARL
jgi:hypothetical protein